MSTSVVEKSPGVKTAQAWTVSKSSLVPYEKYKVPTEENSSDAPDLRLTVIPL